jgi:hypothetical protein
MAPFLLPPYIGALCWTLALQPRGYLDRLTGINLGGFLFSINGLVFVMALTIFPVVYFAVSPYNSSAILLLSYSCILLPYSPWHPESWSRHCCWLRPVWRPSPLSCGSSSSKGRSAKEWRLPRSP